MPKRRRQEDAADAVDIADEVREIWNHLLSITLRCVTCFRPHAGLRVGSVCSGWCSELWALRSLGVPHTPCFACDSDASVSQLCHDTFRHHWYWDDCTSDAFMLDSPTVDIFMAGFPCQDYSRAGRSEGITGPNGMVLLYILAWIRSRLPRLVLLENVVGLLQDHPQTLLFLLQSLQDMVRPSGETAYSVSWALLNTRTRGTIPQNRERIIVVAVHSGRSSSAMEWPEEAAWGTITRVATGSRIIRAKLRASAVCSS